MKYPAIVYQRDNSSAQFADNKKYRRSVWYQVTVIDRDPDSVVVDKLDELPISYHSAFFATQGLNHDVFRMYF